MHVLHGNFNAPVEDLLEEGITVLNVGCGSGIWTLEMARMWPESTFVGIDIAEVFPTPNSDDLSSNCSFICANILERLPFEDGAFALTTKRLVNVNQGTNAFGEVRRMRAPSDIRVHAANE
ncbi:hypothetical protein BC938DRAFT_474588 [Jimgerdemannia flammicorona]|uniref:Methyltransferase domain-containing protein n=1 Tax=Jimgerdemannia flammicorona TaxID=994334 RepID=A0A433Q1X8_9FUNG|nr:hypothetical protein BC938DRAFT_474588 [Jimgerdemannia flammicorona]